MSKLKAGEVAVWVTERAIQILGGNGYTREFPVERWHRDAKIYDIFEGTAEIQQLVISRAISGMHIKYGRARVGVLRALRPARSRARRSAAAPVPPRRSAPRPGPTASARDA